MTFPITSTGPNQPISLYGSYGRGTAAGQYFVAVRISGQPQVIGRFTVVQNSGGGTFVVTASLSAGAYALGGSGSTDGDISVYNTTFEPNNGIWTPSGVDQTITGSLKAATGIGRSAALGAVGRR
jgi:hypothetical protein